MSQPAEKEIDCSGTDEMVCPYCGYEFGDSWEFLERNATHGETECGECDKKFRWTAEYSVTYSTEQVACLNKVPHVFELSKHNSLEGKWNCYRCNECGETKFEDIKEAASELPKS